MKAGRPPGHLASQAQTFRRSLGAWYAENQRDLPWRREPSPYRTVVSEFMLQQTQIKTVLPYFDRWMRLFPDFRALAEAPEPAVLKAWEGLGYYSRARRLHALAKELAPLHTLPDTAAGWLPFTGIGPYTAAAIASIAFGSPDACVDGNVVRILARLTGDTSPLGTSSQAQKRYQALADALLDRSNPGDHNQAMMELGATLCTRHNPLCTVCPVVSLCAAAAAGNQDRIPALERPATEERTVERVLVRDGGSILLHVAPDGGRLAGIAELPAAASLPLRPGWKEAARSLGTLRRSITRFRYIEPVLEVQADQLPRTPGAEFRWVPLTKIDQVILSGPHRKWLGRWIAHGDLRMDA